MQLHILSLLAACIRIQYRYWTGEIALPLADLALNTSARVPPRADDLWRINFSRVGICDLTQIHPALDFTVLGCLELCACQAPAIGMSIHRIR